MLENDLIIERSKLITIVAFTRLNMRLENIKLNRAFKSIKDFRKEKRIDSLKVKILINTVKAIFTKRIQRTFNLLSKEELNKIQSSEI